MIFFSHYFTIKYKHVLYQTLYIITACPNEIKLYHYSSSLYFLNMHKCTAFCININIHNCEINFKIIVQMYCIGY